MNEFYFLYASFLTVDEIITTNLVCKAWKTHSTSPYIWRPFFLRLTSIPKLFSQVNRSESARTFQQWSQKTMGARMTFNPEDLLADVKKKAPGRYFHQNFPPASLMFHFERHTTIAPLFSIFPEGKPARSICLRIKIAKDVDGQKLIPFFIAESGDSFHMKRIEPGVLEMKWTSNSPDSGRIQQNDLIAETLECAKDTCRSIRASQRREYCKTFSRAWTSLTIPLQLEPRPYWASSQVHDWTPLGQVYGLRPGTKIATRHRFIWLFMGLDLHLKHLQDLDPSVELISLTRVVRDSWLMFECEPSLPLRSYLESLQEI